MRHQGTKMIESNRLILRRFLTNDAQAMYKNWARAPEVTKYLTWPTQASVEATSKILDEWTSQYNKDDFYSWGITRKENGDFPIGSISVVDKNDLIKSVQIGYC